MLLYVLIIQCPPAPMLMCAEFVHLCVGGVGLTGCHVLQGSEQGHKLLERTRSLRPSAFYRQDSTGPAHTAVYCYRGTTWVIFCHQVLRKELNRMCIFIYKILIYSLHKGFVIFYCTKVLCRIIVSKENGKWVLFNHIFVCEHVCLTFLEDIRWILRKLRDPDSLLLVWKTKLAGEFTVLRLLAWRWCFTWAQWFLNTIMQVSGSTPFKTRDCPSRFPLATTEAIMVTGSHMG